MKLHVTIGVLALSMAMIAPSASGAVHGVDWVATGAVYGTGSQKVIELTWNGCLGCFFGTYTVKVTDPNTLATTTTTVGGTIFQSGGLPTGPLGLWQQITMVGNAPGLAFQAHQFAGVNNSPHLMYGVVLGSYQGQSFVAAIAPFFWQNG